MVREPPTSPQLGTGTPSLYTTASRTSRPCTSLGDSKKMIRIRWIASALLTDHSMPWPTQTFPPQVTSTSPGCPKSDAETVTSMAGPGCGGMMMCPLVPMKTCGSITSTPPCDVSMVVENCAPEPVGVNGSDAADGRESPLALCAVTTQ